MNLTVKSRRLDTGTGVISLIGEVDVYSVPQAKQAMYELVDAGARQLLIDLTATDYLDSTAMGALVGVMKKVAESGGWVRLVGPSPRIRRLFEITRLDRILPIFDSEEAALGDLSGKEGRA